MLLVVWLKHVQLNGDILCGPNCELDRWFVHGTFHFLRALSDFRWYYRYYPTQE